MYPEAVATLEILAYVDRLEIATKSRASSLLSVKTFLSCQLLPCRVCKGHFPASEFDAHWIGHTNDDPSLGPLDQEIAIHLNMLQQVKDQESANKEEANWVNNVLKGFVESLKIYCRLCNTDIAAVKFVSHWNCHPATHFPFFGQNPTSAGDNVNIRVDVGDNVGGHAGGFKNVAADGDQIVDVGGGNVGGHLRDFLNVEDGFNDRYEHEEGVVSLGANSDDSVKILVDSKLFPDLVIPHGGGVDSLLGARAQQDPPNVQQVEDVADEFDDINDGIPFAAVNPTIVVAGQNVVFDQRYKGLFGRQCLVCLNLDRTVLVFPNLADLDAHKVDVHMLSFRDRASCRHCPFQGSQSEIYNHLYSHSPVHYYACSYNNCNRAFVDRAEYHAHLARHQNN